VNADQSKTHQDSAMLARQLRCHSLHGSHTTQQHQHHLPLLRPCHPVHVPRSAVIAAATTEPQASPQRYDVLALSNLCVDIVLPVDELPPKDASFRQQLLQQLTDHPPSKEQWELGGNCNFMIAASRIGMRVGSIGHVGNDMYGDYLEEVLQVGSSSRRRDTANTSQPLQKSKYSARRSGMFALNHVSLVGRCIRSTAVFGSCGSIPSTPAQGSPCLLVASNPMCLHRVYMLNLCHFKVPPRTCLAAPVPCLQAERVPRVLRLAPDSLKGTPLDQTLLCFVFVDPRGGHSFCSRYDFGPWPLLGGVQQLPPHVLQVRLRECTRSSFPSAA
jgi:hypothetical protein